MNQRLKAVGVDISDNLEATEVQCSFVGSVITVLHYSTKNNWVICKEMSECRKILIAEK